MAMKKPEFTASSAPNGPIDKFIVNRNGRHYQDAKSKEDARKMADELNRKHGMKTIYS